MSLRARASVLDTCKVENVMDSWAARDQLRMNQIILDTTHQIVTLSVLSYSYGCL